MIGIIGLAGGAASIMMGGASLAMTAGAGAVGLGASAAVGTVKLAKDSIQALSPIGAGGSQARKRLMERGLIESGANRTKQLKTMAGKTAGLLGVNVSLASILKQSQIFTGVFGTVFQILGAFVDIMLIPLMPIIKWILNGMIDFIPDVQAASAKMTRFGERVQKYIEDLLEKSEGFWGSNGILWNLVKDIGSFIKNWWLEDAWPVIKDWWDTIALPGLSGFMKNAINELLYALDLKQRPPTKATTPLFPGSYIGANAARGVAAAPFSPAVGHRGVPAREIGPTGAVVVDEKGRSMAAGFGISADVAEMMDQGIPFDFSNQRNAEEIIKEKTEELIAEGFNLGPAIGKFSVGAAGSALFNNPVTKGLEAAAEFLTGTNIPFLDDAQAGSANMVKESVQDMLEITGRTFADLMSISGSAIRGSQIGPTSMTSTAKENMSTAYRTEAEQYEDDLYFQEMMMGHYSV